MIDRSDERTDAGGLDTRLGLAFQEQEREGLKLAAHLRAVAMAAITLWVFILLGRAAWFYVPVIVAFVASGYAHYAMSRRGFRSDAHSFLFFLIDVVLLTFALLAPNPMLMDSAFPWPEQMAFRFGNFNYYYLLIALFVLGSYSGRAMLFAGLACVIAWGAGIAWIATFPDTLFDIPGFDRPEARLTRFLDPHYVSLDLRTTEIIVLLLTAAILATAVSRGRRLLREQVNLTRERANLARYFPPNIVEELAGHDAALDYVRSQNVAVMFVDMVGFSSMAEHNSPEQLIALLRAFHRRVERAVFEHGGTLDKYLGDGALATFGTPDPDPSDPANALRCARRLFEDIDAWNVRRREAGFPTVRLSVGIHYGGVVVGDIGTERRLEFAVIGDTVNVAARLEEATRTVGCQMIVSNDLVDAALANTPEAADGLLTGLTPLERLALRGREGTIDVWALGAED
ncbi:MAG: adenylate/guanylate cyclase domain-containing protein [Alphaproteobacteria bacterium]|nr:adenylate/guanylate cyclase domain-containing protein [Alphaproteobacteria bacterium]